MPASPTGFGNFFMDRNINMPSGYQLLGCPPGMQQSPPHLVGMAGVPLPFLRNTGYSFIPYPHPGHMAHIVSILKHYYFSILHMHYNIYTLFIHHTYLFFISNLHNQTCTHIIVYIIYCVFAILYIAYLYIILLLSVSCPVAVILLYCGASVTITNSLNV